MPPFGCFLQLKFQQVNLRFDFEPAAVAFPTTIEEVSDVVRLGDKINHQVVARSGGVCNSNHTPKLFRDALFFEKTG